MKEINSIRILDVLKSIEFGSNKAALVTYFDEDSSNNNSLGLMLIVTAAASNGTLVLAYQDCTVSNYENGNVFLDLTYGDMYVFADIDSKWNVTMQALTSESA